MQICKLTHPNNKKTPDSYDGFLCIGTLLSLFAVTIFLGTTAIGPFLLFAYGHPKPVHFDPQPNQIIVGTNSLPNKVTIYFTDKPELKASSIQVIDFNNERIDKNDLRLDADKMLSITLDKSKMKHGIYSVIWLILSKDDGFITKGSYYFSLENYSQSKGN
jgi:methionine-rich copper-binding protein CopC